jgi:hypothetical protein
VHLLLLDGPQNITLKFQTIYIGGRTPSQYDDHLPDGLSVKEIHNISDTICY